MLVVGTASAAFQAVVEATVRQPAATVATFVLSLPLLATGYVLSVRRAHDMGWSSAIVAAMSGSALFAIACLAAVPAFMRRPGDWWAVKTLEAGLCLMLLALLLGFIIAVTPRDPRGANQWGPDPRTKPQPAADADHSASTTTPSMGQ